MAGIFISYRRSDAEGWAGRLSDALKADLPGVNIFRDIEDIPPGVNFDTYIGDAVGSCDVLIALIGPRWLNVTDKDGRRRLDDPADFTRIEISTALKRNVRVIPALIGGAEMPAMESLPEDLKRLARRQAYDLSDRRWVEDCRTLAKQLKPTLAIPARSLNAKVAAIAFAVLACVTAAGFGIKLWKGQPTEIPRQQGATNEVVAPGVRLKTESAEEQPRRQDAIEKRKTVKVAQETEVKPERKNAEDKTVRLSEKSVWVPTALDPLNGTTVSQSYFQPWRFKWSAPDKPGLVQQYELKVMGPNAVNPLVDSKITGTEYNFQRRCSYIPDRGRLGWKWEVRAQDQGGNWGEWIGPNPF